VKTIAASTLFTLSGGVGASDRWQAHVPYAGGTIYFDCGAAVPPQRLQATSGWAADTEHLVSFYGSTTDSVQQIHTDGTLLIGDASGHAVPTAGRMALAGYPGVGGYESDVVDIGEVIIINGTVSTNTRQRLEGYLAHKWGLTANLDAGHPYKSTAPLI